MVGIRAEVEQSISVVQGQGEGQEWRDNVGKEEEEGKGDDGWVEVGIEQQQQREDEAEGVFLAEMLREGLLADGNLVKRLVIGRRWHWRLFVDVS